MSKKKKPVTKPLTIEEVAQELNVLNTLQFQHMAMVADMNKQLAMVRDSYQPSLIEYEGQIDQTEKIITDWIVKNAKDFEGPPRSMNFESGTIGFRLGNKRLKPLSKWTWEDVLEELREKEIEDYLRQNPEVDRDKLLDAAQSGILTEIDLKEYGLRVVQDDRPFVETAFTKRVAEMAKKD